LRIHMGNIAVDIFPPAYWQDFEKLTQDIVKIKWKDDYAERHGREGQAQGGIDVYGYNHVAKEHTGIQCKKRALKSKPSHESPSNTLTKSEIDQELANVKESEHQLDRFIIATSGPRDAHLQSHVAKINKASGDLKVSIMFWDDYVDFLNDHPELMYRYYENVLKFRSEYSSLKHYLLLLSMAFDRPAIRTPFYCESRATDFISAISATQQAIATGCLTDREGRVIDQVRVPTPKPKGLQAISNKLQKSRDLAVTALAEGVIVEHECVIEIRDHGLVEMLNNLRFEAVKGLNKLLEANDLNQIEFGGF
ncbi:hypothetical protein ACHELX_004423, partial [Vibrio vulnificus]